jgi:hypothetical protein
MKRKLTIFGLAITAVVATTALTASLGQAEPGAETKFTAAPGVAYPIVGTGTQHTNFDDRFVVTGSTLRCSDETTLFQATLAEASTSLTVTPHYTGAGGGKCTGPLGVGIEVDLNGCHYTFTAGKHTTAEDVHGKVHIVCPTGKTITVTGGNCTTHIGPQTAAGKVTYLNKGTNKITVEIEVTVATSHTNEGFPCTFSNGNGTGTYFSRVLVECFKDLGTHASATTPGTNTYTHNKEVRNCDVGTHV